MLKALEARNFVSRVPHESDGRRSLIEIAAPGLALIREVAPESASIYADIEARIGREQMELILDELELMIERLSE